MEDICIICSAETRRRTNVHGMKPGNASGRDEEPVGEGAGDEDALVARDVPKGAQHPRPRPRLRNPGANPAKLLPVTQGQVKRDFPKPEVNGE